jgi:hypothetical protein
MVQMIKEFIGRLFNQKKLKQSPPIIFNSAPVTVYKTRTQLVEEGKGRYVCRRHTHGIPALNKLN